MFRIIHKFTPIVGTSQHHPVFYCNTIRDVLIEIRGYARWLVDSNRSFTYDPGSKRLDGTHTSLPVITANQGESWHVEEYE